MNRTRVIVAILTFIIGATAVALWPTFRQAPARVSHQPLSAPSVEVTRSRLPSIDESWAFITRDIDWEAPPKEIEQTFKASMNSVIVIFYPSGDFASVGCTLYRDNKTKQMSISMGDDFSVMKGRWAWDGDGALITTSRLTHSGLRVAGRENPVHKERWVIRRGAVGKLASVLERQDENYVEVQDLGNFDQLSAMIADDNQN